MEISGNVKIIPIMQKTLNFVDQRLVNHGVRVAYLLYKVLRLQNRFNEQQLRDICLLGMLHDIGAYKTEEIDRMVIFETIDTWDHSIYGYLFLKYFSPLSDLAQVILYHHADCTEVQALDSMHAELAQLIFLCDRADVYLVHSKDIEGFYRYIEQQRDKKFNSSVIDMFMAAKINLQALTDDLESDKEFLSVFYDTHLTIDDVDKYIRMVVFSIDFRYSQTIIHSITVASIAKVLGKLSGKKEDEIEKISTSALLQGIGKVGLFADDDEIKTTAEITEKILSGNVDDDILRAATKMYKKQNDVISFYDQLLAVADVISALCFVKGHDNTYHKEKIAVILKDMCRDKLLDSDVVTLALDNFDYLMNEVDKESRVIINYYDMINNEYLQIKNQLVANRKK